MKYIKYPVYPIEFNAPNGFLHMKTYNEINRYIRKGINDIILIMELENRNDDDTHSFYFEKGTVEVKYKDGEFYTIVIYDDVTYTSEVEMDMDMVLEPTRGHWDTYHKIRENIENELRFNERKDSRNLTWAYSVIGGFVLGTALATLFI